MTERLELRCNDEDDACQWYELETDEDHDEIFPHKPLHWGTTETNREHAA